jgi:hypothetical protein
MDDDDDAPLTPLELRTIATQCEGTMRCLHKELRRRGLTHASWAALESADAALSTARALAAEMPSTGQPTRRPAATAPLRVAR